MRKSSKRNINIVMLGHVDCGKSTFSGHLLYKLGGIDERVIQRFDRESRELGREHFKYAWVMDKLKVERERGITIEVSDWKFDTKKYEVTLFDCAGYRDYMKNTLTAISLADFGVLVIDATRGGYETGVSRSGQTREHALASFASGVRRLIVVVSKMDEQYYRYNERRFDEITKELRKILKKIGYNPKRIPIIPVSAWEGDNITDTSRNMSWWKKGKGKWGGMNFIEVLDSLNCPKRRTHLPLRIPILNTFKISGIGTVVTGTIETGTISVGQSVLLAPSRYVRKVHSIEKHFRPVQKAYAGDYVGINLRGVSYKDVRRGFVIGDSLHKPPRVIEKMRVRLIVLSKRIREGYEPTLDCKTNHCPIKIEKIYRKYDKKTMEIIQESPEVLEAGDIGDVLMTSKFTKSRTEWKTKRQKVRLVTESFSKHHKFGRILLRDNRMIVGVGMIMKVCKEGVGWCDNSDFLGLGVDEDWKERSEYVKDNIDDRFSIKIVMGFVLSQPSFCVWKSLLAET